MSSRAGGRVAGRRPNLAAVVVLTAVWLLLWDGFSVFLLLTGVLLAVAVRLVFPLPAIAPPGRVHPVALARLVTRQVSDVVAASVRVLRLVFRRDLPKSAILRVQLRSRSDLYLTQTAELVSLTPGSIVVEARRSSSTIYLHVLATVEPDELARAAQDVLDAEARVVRAFGTRAEIEALETGGPWPETEEAR